MGCGPSTGSLGCGGKAQFDGAVVAPGPVARASTKAPLTAIQGSQLTKGYNNLPLTLPLTDWQDLVGCGRGGRTCAGMRMGVGGHCAGMRKMTSSSVERQPVRTESRPQHA